MQNSDGHMNFLDRMERWAKALKRDVVALWLAARDSRVPWHVKAVAGAVAAYASGLASQRHHLVGSCS